MSSFKTLAHLNPSQLEVYLYWIQIHLQTWPRSQTQAGQPSPQPGCRPEPPPAAMELCLTADIIHGCLRLHVFITVSGSILCTHLDINTCVQAHMYTYKCAPARARSHTHTHTNTHIIATGVFAFLLSSDFEQIHGQFKSHQDVEFNSIYHHTSFKPNQFIHVRIQANIFFLNCQ